MHKTNKTQTPGSAKHLGREGANFSTHICADAPKSQTSKATTARQHDRSRTTAAGAGPPLQPFRAALSAVENRHRRKSILECQHTEKRTPMRTQTKTKQKRQEYRDPSIALPYPLNATAPPATNAPRSPAPMPRPPTFHAKPFLHACGPHGFSPAGRPPHNIRTPPNRKPNPPSPSLQSAAVSLAFGVLGRGSNGARQAPIPGKSIRA